MKKKIVFAILFLSMVVCIFPQDQNVDQAISNALRRIATQGAYIENIIYDGMNISEVESILGEKITISSDYALNINLDLGLEYYYTSRHGNYILFWSTFLPMNNPVVIGYMNIKEKRLRHNYL